MNRIIIPLLLIAIPFIYVQAQGIDHMRPQVTPASVDAASMMKAIDFPVSHMTGLPDITIPLYVIQEGDITLPISISYHASGLKPKEGSGRVGTGWTLNAEPSVARQIRGNPDESMVSGRLGWFYRDRENRDIYPNDPHSLYINTMRKLANGSYDSEIDRYTYKLANRGGSFILEGRNAHATTYYHSDDKIKANGFSTFTIESPDGLIYDFGEGGNSIETTKGGSIVRWMCSRISSYKTKAEVTFNYSSDRARDERSIFGVETKMSLKVHYKNGRVGPIDLFASDHVVIGIPDVKTEIEFQDGKMDFKDVDPGTGTLEFSLYNPDDVRYQSNIQAIYFGNKTVEFKYKKAESNGVVVDVLNIIVIGENRTMLKTVNLYITPYNEKTELTKLDSIRILTPGTDMKKYIFRYHNFNSVPSKHTLGIDHWGYANGSEGGKFGWIDHLIPDIDTDVYVNNKREHIFVKGANREVNHEATAAGVLSEIIDPEGLKTKFVFEGNYGAYAMEFYGPEVENYSHLYPVGGLRIKKITTEYAPHRNKVKVYEYGMLRGNSLKTPYENIDINDSINIIWGGGAIKHYISDLDYIFGNETLVVGVQESSKYSELHYNSMPYSIITHPDGSTTHYEVVVETENNTWDADYIKTVYYYKVNKHNYEALKWDDNCHYAPTMLPVPREAKRNGSTSFSWDMPTQSGWGHAYDYYAGRMLKMEEYRKNKWSAYPRELLTLRTIKTYKEINDWTPGTIAARKSVRMRNVVFTSDNSLDNMEFRNQEEVYPRALDEIEGTSWRAAWNRWHVLTGETTEVYTYNDPKDAANPPAPIIKTTTYEYAKPASNPVHMNPVAIRKENSDLSVSIDSMVYYERYPNILLYHGQKKNAGEKESRILLDDVGRTHKVQTRFDSAKEFLDEVVYHEYDDYGNIAHISGKEGRHSCYLWGYENKYPIAQIDNITYDELLSTLNVDRGWVKSLANMAIPDENDVALINELRDKLPDCLISTYTYKPNYGLTSICDPNAHTTYYEHDAEERLKTVYVKKGEEPQVLKKYDYNFFSKSKSPGDSPEELTELHLTMLNPCLPNLHIYPCNQKVDWFVRVLGGSEQYTVKWEIGFDLVQLTETLEQTYYTLGSPRVKAALTIPDTSGRPNGLFIVKCTITDRETGKTASVTGWAYASVTGTQPPFISE